MGDRRVGEQIKDRWHESCFKRVASATNAKKRRWEKSPNFVSLKTFVRNLLKDSDPMAQEWMDHKGGSLDQTRSDLNQKAAELARQASKTARRSKKGPGAPKK